MTMLRLALAVTLAGSTAALSLLSSPATARQVSARGSRAAPPPVEEMRTITVCNAYAHTRNISIYALASKTWLTDSPLSYKECRRLSFALQDGERLEFRSGELPVGTFRATNLPSSGSLLLVAVLRGTSSEAAGFVSHGFASVPFVAQVAVVDAYTGAANGSLHISDHVQRRSMGAAKAELLPTDSVVALGAGYYDVALEAADGQALALSEMDVSAETDYVVMRVGGGSRNFPQELVVFPSPPPADPADSDVATPPPSQRARSGAAPGRGVSGAASTVAGLVLAATLAAAS